VTDQVAETLKHPRPRLAVLCSVIAPVSLVIGWSAAAAAQPGGFDQVGETISALGAAVVPHRWIMTTALVIAGVGHLLTAFALAVARPVGRLLLAGGGIALVAAALLPQPTRVTGSFWHALVAGTALALLAAWPWFSGRHGSGRLLEPRVGRVAAVVLAVLTVATYVWVAFGIPGVGLVERLTVGGQALWPLLVSVSAWWAAGRPVGSPRFRHAIGGVGLAAAAFGGGVVATNVVPATAHTTYYEVSVSLSTNPLDTSDLHTSTIFGDITVEFRGLAPGVDASPRVRTSITQALSQAGLSVGDLQPSRGEIDRAVREVVIGTLARFVVGAALGCAAGMFTYIGWTHRRVNRRHVLVMAGVPLLVTALTGTAIGLTYQPDRLRTYAAGGVLGTVQRNANLLGDVQTRATQTAPYIKNLLALSAALQSKYAPQQLERATAARILLVSDIHGADLYPMMRQIVRTENVDAVIDSGDLLNFGTVQEGEAADIFSGIASLGVPYLFVRGNHDAASANDRSVLRRMARIPNVTVLEPDTDSYLVADVNGVRVAGFNDPRWFGDDNRNNAAKQVPAREAFVRTFEERGPLDVVVSHEPAAVEGIDFGAVRVNGHIHSDDLEGNRVGVGTFTGGGPFNHFLESANGEELTGQPSAFDVLSFGIDCSLNSLSRYQFRDVIEGYPAYDDISLINGSTVSAGTPPAADGSERACSHEQGFRVELVPQAPELDSPETTSSAAASTS
jgi:predicted phosphodiesterase/hypothetical membrane protein